MKKILGLLVGSLVVSLVFFGCKRDNSKKPQEENEKNLVSIVSIGKLKTLEHDSIVIMLTTGGGTQKFNGNDELIKKTLTPNTTVKVGASVLKNGKVIAENREGNSGCPFVTRTLSPGVNHVSLSFCLSEDSNPGDPSNPSEPRESQPNPTTEPDPTVPNPNDKLNIEIETKL